MRHIRNGETPQWTRQGPRGVADVADVAAISGRPRSGGPLGWLLALRPPCEPGGVRLRPRLAPYRAAAVGVRPPYSVPGRAPHAVAIESSEQTRFVLNGQGQHFLGDVPILQVLNCGGQRVEIVGHDDFPFKKV